MASLSLSRYGRWLIVAIFCLFCHNCLSCKEEDVCHCLEDHYIYRECEEEYRLSREGYLHVPRDRTEEFCEGPCHDETEEVLRCIKEKSEDFRFVSGASVNDIKEAIECGCGEGESERKGDSGFDEGDDYDTDDGEHDQEPHHEHDFPYIDQEHNHDKNNDFASDHQHGTYTNGSDEGRTIHRQPANDFASSRKISNNGCKFHAMTFHFSFIIFMVWAQCF
ncbi:hypothetical protein LUZ60_003501 [Juncus effusus]|nr:hypothetical protein LUZ60_003501 [Juncus effusus]